MTGDIELFRQTSAIDALFERARGVERIAKSGDADDRMRLMSDLAQYACVRVSGLLDVSVSDIFGRVLQRSSPPVARFGSRALGRQTNLNANRLVDLTRHFSEEWGEELAKYLVDERKAAVDSIVAQRNNIAHGGHVGLSLGQVHRYYLEVKKVLTFLSKLTAP